MNDYIANLDKKVLQGFFRPIAAIADEPIQMEFVKEGIRVCQLSKDHVSVITATFFDDHASEGLKVQVSLKRLMDAISACGESLTIQVAETSVTVGDGVYTRTIRTDEPDDRAIRIPNIDGETIDLTEYSGRLQNVVLGDTVSFAWGRGGVEIGSADETGQAWYSMPMHMDSEGSATFPSEYAVGLLRAIPKDCKVSATIADSSPIKVDYTSEDFKGSILIAPRISAEEE